jgi:hypothetical protein
MKMAVFWYVETRSLVEIDRFSEVFTDIIISSIMMKIVSFSETSSNFYKIKWRSILKDNHFHTLRRENLKYQQYK